MPGWKCLVTWICSNLLGLFIAVSAKEVFEAQTYPNFFRFPMIFLCGLFIPLNALPILIQPLSYILPVTYGVDVLHFAISGTQQLPVGLDFVLLFLFRVLLFYMSIINIKKKWIV